MEENEDKLAAEEPQAAATPAWRRYGLTVLDIVLFAILFVVLSIATQQLTLMLYEATKPGRGLWPVEMAWLRCVMELGSLISVGVAALIVLRIRRLPLSGLGLCVRGRGRDVVSGLLVSTIIMVVGFAVCCLTGAVRVTGVTADIPLLAVKLLFFLLVGVTEELMCRGFVLGRLMDGGMNRYVALVVSAALFSLMHLANPSFAFIPFLNILLAGILLGSTYIYTRNLAFPIALHWAWNFVQGPVLGFHVSGTGTTHYLLQLQTDGSALISGGEFGFEGSLLCSVLMVVFIIAILMRPDLLRRIVHA